MERYRQGRARTITALLITLCAFVVFGCERGEKAPPPPEKMEAAEAGQRASDMAPDFELTTFDGRVVRLAEMRGAPVVLNFWASWCGPCRLEAPVLKEAYDAFGNRGVAFVGVAVQDEVENSKAFIRGYGWAFPVGPDSTGEIMRAYRVFGIPKTYIIDSSGRVSFIVTGAVSKEVLFREIEKVL